MLDDTLKKQLVGYMQLVKDDLVIVTDFSDDDASQKVNHFVEEVAQLSSKITLEKGQFTRRPSFGLKKKGEESARVIFSGLPMGHEFASFVLALLQVSGHEPKIDEKIKKQIQSINRPLHFETYVSLTCHNCPDVVQALNIMAILNPHITSTMIEGGMNKEEIEKRDVLAVPTVFLNDEEWANGRMSIEELVNKASDSKETLHLDEKELNTPFDVLVVGGGPSAASSAIYAVRKGLKVGMVMNRFGGQPLETLGIENIIGTPYIEGEKLMANIEEHVKQYPIVEIKGHEATHVEKKELVEVTLESGDILKTKTAIVATGAHWRAIGVPGEKEFKSKGVCYCPHCDGPLFKEKDVAVIGGGNSGVEAAIDLAGICRKVTLLEFSDVLKADEVLQNKLRSLTNVSIVTNAATQEISGNGKVDALTYENRQTKEQTTIAISGVFILIGLQPNTAWLEGSVELNPQKEIIVDTKGSTSLSGVFAAGDCTNQPYKQIIISMGSGATAALGAFDYMIRH